MDDGPEIDTPSGLPLDASMLDGLPDPVILVDQQHIIVDYNRAARHLLGRGALTRKLDDLLNSEQIIDEVAYRLAGAPSTQCEIFLPYPIARYYELNVWRLPDLTSPGPAWAMLVLHDVTASKKAAQMRADFVANVSHELRSPLSSLLGFIETLRGPAANDPEATAHFLEIMEKEAKRMTRLVNDLLALSKVETAEHIQPDQTINLEPVLALVMDTLSVRAHERGMRIELAMSEPYSDVHGDRDELTQVFQNLVSNAISYGKTGSTIRIVVENVGTEGSRQGVAVSVTNEGEGIPEEEIPRLTERFYRVDKGRSRSMGGTGLGLAIVKHIIARHRGVLTIKSDLGKQTTFTVSFPHRLSDDFE